ncbi:MAG: hypothetical protein A2X67_10105 [Ignavibacteria bacterium GWA2_55_11]|nr:MAG: hypothetical protein A2X67_10105 [Ignavibacteria bacterium GWA2_55_11]OGU63240.1 MAG: hypothetical protein A3C56_10275 [Ignavibacteria bacterium RIFCSPHIGHO2_02_FULL_56_12]OGU70954.1 MAG: hypothetical protein A3H45_12435 [Ignavibacteria bacterium RIFCSPLOWO2_02_FULL_55_14]OGU76562.1 MAG: hypothetical protein A3G43_04565 [Ignavibacteria bacterium RIFCSPLOWO2_12_FULL_56_21]
MEFYDTLLLLCSYVLGCVTTGFYLVSFVRHTDLRFIGDRSLGARNVYHVLGFWGFLVVATVDLLKGMIAVWLAGRYGTSVWIPFASIVAVTSGHVWPCQLRFRGGKGIMTATGGMLILDPLLMLSFIGLLVPVLIVLRRLDISGLIVVAFAPLIAFVLGRSEMMSIMLATVAIIVLFAHREILKQELGLGKTDLGKAWEDVGE